MEQTGLIKYDAMCNAIASCHQIDEVKEIRDKAIALERYAQQALNMDAERKACEIRLRAERKAGSLLKEKEREQGSRSDLTSGHAEPKLSEYAEAKSEAGISDNQAKRWQKLASVDENQFEEALKDPETKPSTTGIIKKANGQTTTMDPDALWLWGRLRDFERMRLDDKSPRDLLGEMTGTMISDVVRIAPIMSDYLENLSDESNQ